jgi:hypothetical protein
MTLRNVSLALATFVAVVAGATEFDRASAEFSTSADEQRNQFVRAPRPNQSLPGATSRPNRDLRGVPSMRGRGMRGMGGGRMNGSMGGRR